MQSDLEILKKIQDVCNLLDEIDESQESISKRISDSDMALEDLEHQLENEILTDAEIIGISKKIISLRKERRARKNELEIIKVYSDVKTKLPYKEQRPFFKQQIGLKTKNLNQPYKNRIYSEEEIQEIKSNKLNVNLNIELKTKRTKGSTKIDIQELKKEWLRGKTQRELALMFNCTQPTINYYIKKIKEEGNK